jgi:4'-phosphopantetheinyl transferase EntD
MRELLSSDVSVVEAHLPEGGGSGGLVSADRERRAAESALGRTCARLALLELGRPATVVESGPDGEPLWPSGVVGSITHRRGYAAAAATTSEFVAGLGIDAELRRPLSPGALARICTPEEIARSELDSNPLDATIVFSLKEAVYKAVFGANRLALNYHDVTIALDHASAQADVMFVGARADHPNLAGLSLRSRFTTTDTMIATAAALRRRAG